MVPAQSKLKTEWERLHQYNVMLPMQTKRWHSQQFSCFYFIPEGDLVLTASIHFTGSSPKHVLGL